MHIRFHPEAENEVRRAGALYAQEGGKALQLLFAAALEDALHGIADYPQAGSLVRPDVRKRLLSKFPFYVLYSIQGDQLWIIALAHTSRHPEYWRTRLE